MCLGNLEAFKTSLLNNRALGKAGRPLWSQKGKNAWLFSETANQFLTSLLLVAKINVLKNHLTSSPPLLVCSLVKHSLMVQVVKNDPGSEKFRL